MFARARPHGAPGCAFEWTHDAPGEPSTAFAPRALRDGRQSTIVVHVCGHRCAGAGSRRACSFVAGAGGATTHKRSSSGQTDL
eukprot:2542116-Prymnesium_polylepis.2